MTKHASVMDELKLALNKITKRIKHKDIIYLDYPLHHNIGDLLIYLGAIKLIERAGFNIVAKFSAQNYSKRKIQHIVNKYQGEISLVFHGGGNFGDLYNAHQDFRRDVLANFNDINTILFPQTVFYKDKLVLEQDQSLFSKHKDLSFFVRDMRSKETVEMFCKSVELCPDTAHMLWKEHDIKPTHQVINEELILRRWDVEGDNDKNKFDWKQKISSKTELYKKILFLTSILNPFSFIDRKIDSMWYRHSLRLCFYFVNFFNSYKTINTDRLHGHILACLLSKPNKVYDNSYGKNSAYINQWTKDSELVEVLSKVNL